jgi:hypothetical protein
LLRRAVGLEQVAAQEDGILHGGTRVLHGVTEAAGVVERLGSLPERLGLLLEAVE